MNSYDEYLEEKLTEEKLTEEQRADGSIITEILRDTKRNDYQVGYENGIKALLNCAELSIRDDTCSSAYDAKFILNNIAGKLLKNMELEE